ncbi:CPBP family intramembrane glutamic endopeptidase [Sphingomonas sp. BK580]|uniref:CPBP family intramembrane glutamic endopeptidase n=1 Tax=Sphingomonas sp. BK580 TaxID=2586972 RepID=UPI00160E4D6C|nr:CPBP family intramembrane glutamic endopeptidase [Sphingomonas sp. BK580]MBB3691600.1 membrane protease YdiL (CAAX protease family) [Sphingomonas sp. BK580]
MLAAPLWLAVGLASLALFLRGGTRHYRWLYRPGGDARRRRFLLRALRPTLHFAVVTLVALVALGRLHALAQLPAEFAPARAAAIDLAGGTMPLDLLAWSTLGGLAVGGVIAGLVERWRGRSVTLGDVESVLPTTRGELGWGTLLSVTAGVTEELFFRLLLPLLLVSCGVPGVAAFALSCALFGAAHRYQGWIGMAATALVGAVLTLAYLLSGSLAAAMLLHVAIDLNALVVRPLLSGRVR